MRRHYIPLPVKPIFQERREMHNSGCYVVHSARGVILHGLAHGLLQLRSIYHTRVYVLAFVPVWDAPRSDRADDC